MDLTCPKCRESMRSYERGGITIDQCTQCRGIFLDRGELERLIDAETSHYAKPTAPVPVPDHKDAERGRPEQRYPEPRYSEPRYSEPRDEDHRHDRPRDGKDDYSRKRKRKSFLEELFD